MTDEKFISKAKDKVTDWLGKYDIPILPNAIRVTWYCYLAGNYKCLISLNGLSYYFEVTYIAKENKLILDEYDKKED